jgi:outer membrane protein assembly factor BamE
MSGRFQFSPLRRPVFASAVLAALVWLAGCQALDAEGSLLGLITPYRIDIVQGNVVTKEQLALVRPGMTRVQVRDILGSPLVTDLFHADRWDYVFTIRRPGTPPQRRALVAIFDGDILKRIDAPELPSEREFVAQISRTSTSGSAPALELTDEERKALPVPDKPAQQAARPSIAGPARSYPPLEPR